MQNEETIGWTERHTEPRRSNCPFWTQQTEVLQTSERGKRHAIHGNVRGSQTDYPYRICKISGEASGVKEEGVNGKETRQPA